MLCRCHLLLLATLVTAASCRSAGPIRMCGHRLADEIARVCKGRGGYNDPFSHVAGNKDLTPKRSAELSSGPGLADDCCYKDCSRAIMELYCKDGPTLPDEPNSGVQSSPPRSTQRVKADQAAENVERQPPQTTTPPLPRFRIGTVTNYYLDFVLQPANKGTPNSLSEERV